VSLINEGDLQENLQEKKDVLQESLQEKKDVLQENLLEKKGLPVSEKLVLNYVGLSLMKDEEKREGQNIQKAEVDLQIVGEDLQIVGEDLQVEDEDVVTEVLENDNQPDIQEGVGIVVKNTAIEEDHEIDCLQGEFIADQDYSKLMD
jgi:hypothetical protein